MKILSIYADECRNELNALNIHYAKNIRFDVKEMHDWGKCIAMDYIDELHQYRYYTIYINKKLLDDRCDTLSLKTTIIHELLHTCANSFCHTRDWKRLADYVNLKLGYNVKRTDCSTDKLPYEMLAERVNENKYVLKCEKCGQMIFRNRMSNLLRYPEQYRCARKIDGCEQSCGGMFIREK